jgi:hypothetical protein
VGAQARARACACAYGCGCGYGYGCLIEISLITSGVRQFGAGKKNIIWVSSEIIMKTEREGDKMVRRSFKSHGMQK